MSGNNNNNKSTPDHLNDPHTERKQTLDVIDLAVLEDVHLLSGRGIKYAFLDPRTPSYLT
jgi:hypothetical protein